jgi:fatty-acid desaturase
MLTFLGAEKYAVMTLMLVLAFVGFALVARWTLRSFWNKWDVIAIGALMAILTGAGIIVIFHPAWPVTPLHMLLR